MILRALFLRTVLRRPVRLAMTVAGVAVGVASVVATLLANRAAIASLDAGVEQVAGAARLEITRPGGLDVEVLGALRPLADDGLFVPVVDEVAQVPAWRDRVRVLGVDLLVDGDVRALAVDSGADDELAAERFDTLLLGRGVAVPRSLAEERGLALGDPLELLTSSRRERFEVAGIFDPPGFSSVWDRVLVVDVALAQEVFGRSASLDRIEVRPRHELDLDAFAQRIRAALPAGHQVEAPSARREEGRRMVRALEFNLTALAGISVLVGVVLVATALATSVVQRRYALALLRSLGASRAQLARSVLVEAAGIGLAGGVAGALLGWAGARGALEGVSASVASITSEALPGRIRFELFHLLLGAGLGLASACVAALLPLREALGTPPLQGLVAERPETLAGRRYGQRLALFAALLAVAWGLTRVPPLEDRPIFALGSALVLLSTLLVVAGPSIDLATRGRRALARAPRAAPLRVAQAALAAGRQRAAWAAGAVGTAVGLAVAMTTMIGSFRATVVDWTDQAMRSDLFVRPLPTAAGVPAGRIAPEVQRVAFELFGEHAVDSYQSADATFRGQRVQLAGVGMRAAQGRKALPFLDGRDAAVVLRAAREQRRAIVNEPFARRFGVGRGDRIELATRGGVIAPVVEGVFADYSSHTGLALVDRAWFAELHPDEGPQPRGVPPRRGRACRRPRAPGERARRPLRARPGPQPRAARGGPGRVRPHLCHHHRPAARGVGGGGDRGGDGALRAGRRAARRARAGARAGRDPRAAHRRGRGAGRHPGAGRRGRRRRGGTDRGLGAGEGREPPVVRVDAALPPALGLDRGDDARGGAGRPRRRRAAGLDRGAPDAAGGAA